MEEEKQKKAVEQDIRAYSKLKQISQAEGFEDYRELVLDLTAKEMFNAFMPNTIKSWDNFVESRAKITALLLPLQEVLSAEGNIKRLREHLNTYYQ